MKTDYEIENERALAGGGRAGWEARERIKRHQMNMPADKVRRNHDDFDWTKLEAEIKCPKCGETRAIEEWRKDTWRCRGCAEYLPYEIRSKYFKR